jgi:hypothetical protein
MLKGETTFNKEYNSINGLGSLQRHYYQLLSKKIISYSFIFRLNDFFLYFIKKSLVWVSGKA